MVIKPCGFNMKCPDIYLNNSKLVFVENTNYLGLAICNDLKDGEDMLRHLRSFYARSTCFMHIVVQLVCSQHWVSFNKGTYLKLKVAYNNMHRQILGYIFVSNGIDTFDALMRKNVYGFRKRILNIDNDMIKCMYNWTNIVNGPMWTSWVESLYIVRW